MLGLRASLEKVLECSVQVARQVGDGKGQTHMILFMSFLISILCIISKASSPLAVASVPLLVFQQSVVYLCMLRGNSPDDQKYSQGLISKIFSFDIK